SDVACWSCPGNLPADVPRGRFDEAKAVPERIADREVGTVELLGRLLGDLDTLGLQLGVQRGGVGGDETDRETGGALGDDVADLLRGGGVDAWWSDLLEQDLPVGHPLRPDGQPAHGASELHVGAHLEAQLAYVELQSLVLVEYPHVRDVDAGDHASSSLASAAPPGAADAPLYGGEARRASPKLLGRAQAMAKQVGTARTGWWR